MTVSLTYNDDLGRVIIDASGLGGATEALVEWSTDGTHWTTVRGGSAVAVSGGEIVVPLSWYEFSDNVANTIRVTAGVTELTASITPVMDTVWLKSLARPYLNRPVQVVQPAAMSLHRPARTGVFDIVGRSYPVAVNDVRKSKRWTMLVRTEDADEAEGVDFILASGDVLLVHVPECMAGLVPGGYVTVGDVDVGWHPLRPYRRTYTLPCIEVAPPGPEVTGALGTWQTVIDGNVDWAAVLAQYGSWADLLEAIGSGSEVIVP